MLASCNTCVTQVQYSRGSQTLSRATSYSNCPSACPTRSCMPSAGTSARRSACFTARLKVSLLAAAQPLLHGGAPACSRLPFGPEARALVARMPTKGCSGVLVPAQSRRCHTAFDPPGCSSSACCCSTSTRCATASRRRCAGASQASCQCCSPPRTSSSVWPHTAVSATWWIHC